MASESAAMVVSNHGGYSRGEGIPALPTTPATNLPGRFQISVGPGDILPHYPRRASKMPILDNCSATSCSSIKVSFRAMKLGSNAHNKHIYRCARAMALWLQCNWWCNSLLFHCPKIAGKKYASPINNIWGNPSKNSYPRYMAYTWCWGAGGLQKWRGGCNNQQF